MGDHKTPVPGRDKIRASHGKINQIPCPAGAAAEGKTCRNPNGSYMQVPHQARRHAAAEAGVYQP